MEASKVNVSRRIFSDCNECGLCLGRGEWRVKRFETKLTRAGRKPVKLQVCGTDGGVTARLAKELAFYMSLPLWTSWLSSDGHIGSEFGFDVVMSKASVTLGKRLRKFFSADEQAQLAAAGSAEMVDLPWLAEATQ
jgi:hypothetical protein